MEGRDELREVKTNRRKGAGWVKRKKPFLAGFFVFGCIVLQMRKFYLEWATTDASQCGWSRHGEAARPGRG